MDWYQTVFEVIDMRSFSNLWFWIMLAVIWSSASYFVIGVPFDLITRAGRHGGQAAEDLATLVRINVNRILYISTVSGLWLTGLGFFFLTILALLGFGYRMEFAQAVFLILLPLSGVAAVSVRTCHDIHNFDLQGDALRARLMFHRRITQVIGMFAIFVTAMWGMYQNLSLGVLGG